MKYTIGTSIMTILLIAIPGAQAAKEGHELIDRGLDGESRVYGVICPDGKRTGLEHKYKENRICIHVPKGPAVCQNGNDLDSAARKACSL